METCENCGVPLSVSASLNWESNGVISLENSPRNRMVFFESDSIDELFKGIEALIGMPIEHIVIESRCRETKRFIERTYHVSEMITPEIRESLARSGGQEIDTKYSEESERMMSIIKLLNESAIDITRAYGYGELKLSARWDTGGQYPWRNQTVKHPYSILFTVADNLGTVEAFEGTSMWVEYREIAKDHYDIEVSPGEHPIALSERLKRKRYDFKTGDIDFELCPICGIPLEVSRRRWDLEKGTITDTSTGRRMSIFGPFSIDSVLDDLESELGEAIPETVVEAQRRYIKSAWSDDRWNRDGTTFQHMVALRGLGDLKSFKGDKNHVSIHLQNACLHLPMVGATQALVELAYRVEDTRYEWELKDDGDLFVTIIVR